MSKVLIDDAVEGVRAALGDDLDVGPSRTTEGRVVQRGLHLEFFDALRRWHGECDGSATAHRVDVDAVDLEIVLRHARAVHRNGLRVPPDTSVVREMSDCTWRESQHLCHIACGQRQR